MKRILTFLLVATSPSKKYALVILNLRNDDSSHCLNSIWDTAKFLNKSNSLREGGTSSAFSK